MQWKRLAGFSILTIVGIYVALMAGCASMKQTPEEVYIRESGGELKFWKWTSAASEIHWPFAWAAVAAYQDQRDPKRSPLKVKDPSLEPHAFLRDRGWTQWTELPSIEERPGEKYPNEAKTMRDVHLRAEVWSNEATKQVIVAFGGTAATSADDWKANFRWLFHLFSDKPDEYSVLTDTFVRIFRATYLDRASKPDGTWLIGAEIVSTGHSLGGGLAQRFAYSFKTADGICQVAHVYAFDPSPVSGKHDAPFVKEVAPGLTIYRIYNRGETLASVRSILQLTNRNNEDEQGQTWLDIRYRDNWSWRTLLPSGTVHAHGMYDLACFMARHLPTDKAPNAAALTSNCLVDGDPVQQ